MLIPDTGDRYLTYCMNVHNCRTLKDLHRAVDSATRVWERFRSKPSFARWPKSAGLGMWLNAEVAEQLETSGEIDRLVRQWAEKDVYVFTLNGFPFGVFHGTRVKENVYRPDWTSPERKEYTLRLARLLTRMLPENITGSISTVPVTYRRWCTNECFEKATAQLREVIGVLRQIDQETGRKIRLLLEPEPDCLLDDAESTLAFWHRFRDHPDFRPQDGEYLGVCLDLAHTATLFEDPLEVLSVLKSEDIPVVKLQISAVPEIISDETDSPELLLAAFRDEIYLHQSKIVYPHHGSQRFTDLPEVFPFLSDHDQSYRCRTHFHVPLTWSPPEGMHTTVGEVSYELLQQARELGVEHFECELYCLGLMLDDENALLDILADDLCYVAKRLMPAIG